MLKEERDMVMQNYESLLFGASLMGGMIVGFGPQNLFVLRNGLAGRDYWVVPLVSTACDALLVALGIMTAGHLAAHLGTHAIGVLSRAGALLLLFYALRSLYRAFSTHDAASIAALSGSRPSLAFYAIGFSLLNPYVYLDSLVMVGVSAASLEAPQRILFGMGAVATSALWFFGLTLGARILKPKLMKPAAGHVIDFVVAMLCFSAAWKLY